MHAGWLLAFVMLLYAAFSPLPLQEIARTTRALCRTVRVLSGACHAQGVLAEWHFLQRSKRDPVRANVAIFVVWCVWLSPQLLTLTISLRARRASQGPQVKEAPKNAERPGETWQRTHGHP